MILDYLKKFGEWKKEYFEKILLDKLPDALDKTQKSNKIKNNLQKLRVKGLMHVNGKFWKMSKP